MGSVQYKINELMTQKKISAIDIERTTGLNRNTVYSIIAGNSKNPSAQNLKLIAKALDVSLESLLIDEQDLSFDALTNEQMIIFSETTKKTIDALIQKNVNLPLNKITGLIKEVYEYSIKTQPPSIDERFINWVIDKTL